MLTAGTRVGPYEIVSWLGAGGMGEVYRAFDTKLQREVALKTLPEELAREPERLTRLRQEARILASLNHPGIATLHGLEESDGNAPVLVMELVDGTSLADRLILGPLPLQDALNVAEQIAQALEAAHQKGVLHRDLKPANVQLTHEGRVKLLDFGLAKPMRQSALDSRLSTESVARSEAGHVAGTAPYMSPEQARGQEVDRRSDVWSFGCVLFEMIAGKRAFPGASFSDNVAAILDREPDWAALPAATPPALHRLLRRCLQKDKDRRLRDIGDARLELDEPLADRDPVSVGGHITTEHAAEPRASWRRSVGLSFLGLAAGAVVATLTVRTLGIYGTPTERPVERWSIALPAPRVLPTASESFGFASSVALSPDGGWLAYAALREGHLQIYLRGLDQLEAKPIPGTEGGLVPFFSPDGRWLGFFAPAEYKLKKVPLGGGAPIALCATGEMRGATWAANGTIVFTQSGASGLYRVSDQGGTPEVLTTLDTSRGEGSHRLPDALPGGKAVVFTAKDDDIVSFDDARIEAVSLKTRERSLLIAGGTGARYAAGHLIYAREGALWAVPLDAERLKVTGTPVRVLEGAAISPVYGSVDFALSREGSLAYVPGRPGSGRRLLRRDRSGKFRPLTEERRNFSELSLSPDGRRLAVAIHGANDQVWIYDLERSTLTPLTLRWNNGSPLWTPDGRRLTFFSNRNGTGHPNIFWQPADGSGPAETLTTSDDWQVPQSWSPDGKALLFTSGGRGGSRDDIWLLPLEGDRKPKPLLVGPYNEHSARVSPNGRWLAYVSDESGRDEVYVRTFPGSGSRWTISTDGGQVPVWARSGRELFYRSGDRMMAVSVATEAGFSATRPRTLFEAKAYSNEDFSYDVTPDGEFLMIESGEADSPVSQVDVVVNWMQEVRRRTAGQ